jgi:hypothetical protein
MDLASMFGFAGPVGSGEPDEPPISPPQNPWLTKAGVDGALDFSSAEMEEQEIARVHEPLARLFRHPELARSASLKNFSGSDWDEPLALSKYLPAPARQHDSQEPEGFSAELRLR